MPTNNHLPGLDALFTNRFHGAGNIRGVRFQVTYYALRAFELYIPDGPEIVIGEGLEDVDLRRIQAGNEYVQVKHRSGPFNWSDLAGIIQSFLTVLDSDPRATFTVVTNARFAGKADAVQKHVRGGRQLSGSERKSLTDLIKGHRGVELDELLHRLSFVRVSQEEVEELLRCEIMKHFSVTVDIVSLYAAALCQELLSRSSERLETRRSDLEVLRIRVLDSISYGDVNHAVRDGFVFPLRSGEGSFADDYFEGRSARPSHIFADLDVRRPEQDLQIAESLRKVQTCIVLASSGQGKSTLAYRYAVDHYPKETVYVVATCQNDEDVGQIAAYLRQRLCLGLRILILVDNLSHSTRLWHQLAARLAGERMSIIVTAREEDWFRYAGQTTGVTWEIVRPSFSRTEARAVFSELKARGRVDSRVPSVEWALEMLGQPQLLIEFIYLSTHGQLLDERLNGQIRTLKDEPDARGKLQTLRFVSAAHRYGVAIPSEFLVRHAGFEIDPYLGLGTLEGEYVACEDGLCTGLHPVRSERLSRILHGGLGTEATLQRLIVFLDGSHLEKLVAGALADPTIRPGWIVDALAEKCIGEPPDVAARMARICLEAEQSRYFQRHRPLFDQAYQEGGDGIVELLATQTVPIGQSDIIGFMRSMEPGDQPTAKLFEQLIAQFSPRTDGDRVDRVFLTKYLAGAKPTDLSSNIPALADLAQCCLQANVPTELTHEGFAKSCWEERIFEMEISQAADVAFAVYRTAQDLYEEWRSNQWQQIVGYYKWRTRTLSVEEKSESVLIEFPIEWRTPAPSPHEQTMVRLSTLYRLLPYYQTYGSNGLYLLGEDQILGYDETHKCIKAELMWQEIDTRLNRSWIRACVNHYAADTLTTWVERWSALRTECHRFVNLVASLYSAALRGHAAGEIVNALVSAWTNEIQPSSRRLHFAPPGLPAAERERLERAANGWNQAFQCFGQQFFQSSPQNPDDSNRRLMRVNLRNALRALDSFHTALQSAASLVGSNLAGDLSGEVRDYERLIHLIDYWLEFGAGASSDPTRDVAAWTRRSAEEAYTKIRQAADLLRAEGMHIPTLPQLFDDGGIPGLHIAFEVRNFHEMPRDVLILAVAAEEAGISWDFLYAVPLLGGKRYMEKVFRLWRQNIGPLLAGQEVDGPLVLPVVPEGSVASVLGSIPLQTPPEVMLAARLFETVAEIARQLRLRQAARSLLDSVSLYEARLLADYEQETSERVAELLSELDELIPEFGAFPPPPPAAGEWDLVVAAVNSLEQKARNGSLDAGEWPAPLETAPFQLEVYLNKAYLSSP